MLRRGSDTELRGVCDALDTHDEVSERDVLVELVAASDEIPEDHLLIPDGTALRFRPREKM